MNCKDCKYVFEGGDWYECRKLPPVVVVLTHGIDSSELSTEFPQVHPEEYCWEYEHSA